ncbi:hypothetical protein D9M71_705830 [compost metagenome]
MRPRFQPAVPAGMPVPITRSSISAASIPARSTAARMAKEAMVGDVVLLNAPRNALAIGVRAVERMTASFMVESCAQIFSIRVLPAATRRSSSGAGWNHISPWLPSSLR